MVRVLELASLASLLLLFACQRRVPFERAAVPYAGVASCDGTPPSASSTSARAQGNNVSVRAAPSALTATGTASAPGLLSKAQISEVIRRNLPRFKYCYEQTLNAGRTLLRAEVSVRFRIEPGGRVGWACVARTTARDDALERCMVERMQQCRFDPPRDDGFVVVTYPFVFQAN